MNTAKKLEEKYTYKDYIKWNDSEDWEIINGEAYAMAPSPITKHQSVSGNIFFEIKQYLKGKPCKIYSELDVVLSEENIVKPDIIIVCDKEKITEKNIKGSPDMVVEILSPSTAIKDKTIKLELYKKYGVKEYWIVDPIYQDITVHYFSENKSQIYYIDENKEINTIPVKIFGEELSVDLTYIFESDF